MVRGALVFLPFVFACGTVVDMGGPIDGSVDSSHAPAPECAPCATVADCVAGLSCAYFHGDLYCLATCASSSCGTNMSCESTTVADGGALTACLPSTGDCVALTGPLGPDGGPLDHCGAVDGPTLKANCEACSKSASDCQPNGCYGGYWCNTSIHDCEPPPTSCP